MVGQNSTFVNDTNACGLVDRSDRGKLKLTGSGAREFLQGQVTNDIEAVTAA